MKKENVKSFFIGVFTFIYILTIFNFINNKKTQISIDEPQTSPSIKVSQYSDKNITKNAIETNPEYKKIAFEQKSNFSINQIASVINSITEKKYIKNNSESDTTKEMGSWIWTPTLSMTDEYMDLMVNQLKEQNINTIYLSLDSYLDIFTMTKEEEKQKKKRDFTEKVQDFIIKANLAGIQVDAEAGWRNWAEEGNEYKPLAILEFVKNYNDTHINKFRGFQYDVEPYLLENYEKNKKNILKNLVSLIHKTENFLQNTDLRFSVVVPEFYDGKDKMTPKFSYMRKKQYVLDHILDILDRRPNNSLIIMSYRNFAEGLDGSIDISKNEMETSKKHHTKIIIAQETGKVLPEYITFHDKSKEHLFEEIQKINGAFDSYSNFAGIAIHYTNAFLALK